METHHLVVDRSGERLDVLIARVLPGLSRARAQRLIGLGLVSLDGRPAKAGARLKLNQVVEVNLPPPEPSGLEPEAMDLEVVYEDEHLLVINKPPGLVVHPAPGHPSGTLVNALLARCPDLKGVGGVQRPGIVHRLDKDTSGLLIVAKDDPTHRSLSRALKRREVSKTYLALVLGLPKWREKEVRAAIGRHPVQRKKMAVRPEGREAVSRFRLKEGLKGPLSLLEVDLLTGRTHQIRVHAAYLGHPLAGDPLYGSRSREARLSGPARGLVTAAGRQLLHAWRLEFEHPLKGLRLSLTAEPPADLAGLVEALRLES